MRVDDRGRELPYGRQLLVELGKVEVAVARARSLGIRARRPPMSCGIRPARRHGRLCSRSWRPPSAAG